MEKVKVVITLEVERKELERELGFYLADYEWNNPNLLIAIILDNPEVIPKFISETSVR